MRQPEDGAGDQHRDGDDAASDASYSRDTAITDVARISP
jgi:hypothetical protein